MAGIGQERDGAVRRQDEGPGQERRGNWSTEVSTVLGQLKMVELIVSALHYKNVF